MKSKIFLLLAFATTMGCNNSDETIPDKPEENTSVPGQTTAAIPNVKKYQLPAGTITYETKSKAGNYNSVTKSIVYFDDYGMKERKDSYDEEGNLKESFFSDGQSLYLLIHEDKSAFKRGNAYRGTEFKFDWDEIPSKDKDSGKAKKGGNETILGKDCEVFYHESSVGKAKYAGWQNICLAMDMEGSGVISKTIAQQIEEGPVPAEKFAVPADYKMQ